MPNAFAGRPDVRRSETAERLNSSGGYIYVLYGEDTFGRDEAVQTLKDRMRALAARLEETHHLLRAETTWTAGAVIPALPVSNALGPRLLAVGPEAGQGPQADLHPHRQADQATPVTARLDG